MTDLKNLIQVSFPDAGVSVIVYAVIVFFPFLFLFSFLFLFLVDVGRSPNDNTDITSMVSLRFPRKKISEYIICIV